jgi:predicted hydrocarbon binding protein
MKTGQIKIDAMGHIIAFNEYISLLPSGVVLKLRDLLESSLGPDKADSLIKELGKFQVEAAAKRYVETLGIEKLSKMKLMEFTYNIINILGWGLITIDKLSIENKTAHITLRESALALKYKKVYQKNSDRPIDSWIAGILEKHFSVILQTNVEVNETKCISMGHPFCEFIMKPEEKV